MAGYLTTHVLDTARGCPAEGLRIELYKIVKDSRNFLSEALTNDDGRTDKQILSSAEFEIGEYELLFHCGDYIARHNQGSPRALAIYLKSGTRPAPIYLPCKFHDQSCSMTPL